MDSSSLWHNNIWTYVISHYPLNTKRRNEFYHQTTTRRWSSLLQVMWHCHLKAGILLITRLPVSYLPLPLFWPSWSSLLRQERKISLPSELNESHKRRIQSQTNWMIQNRTTVSISIISADILDLSSPSSDSIAVSTFSTFRPRGSFNW